MYVKNQNSIEMKMKLAFASVLCSIITVSSAVAMVVGQANIA